MKRGCQLTKRIVSSVSEHQKRLLSIKPQICSAPFPEFDSDPAFTSYQQIYDYSINNPAAFWDRLAKNRLTWLKPYKEVLSLPENKITGERMKWFSDGTLNASENCLDRHVAVDPNRIALLWERDDSICEEISYKELLNLTSQIGNMLRGHGVKKGDTVTLYMPVSPQLVATMLASARIGAVHSVVFAGFSADALAARIVNSGSKVIVTTDQAVRGGKIIDTKRIVDEAAEKCKYTGKIFVSNRIGVGKPSARMKPGRDLHLEAESAKFTTYCRPEEMSAEDDLFLLFTSGSTGEPKGVVHTTAGYLLYAAATHQLVYDYKQGERFGCVADIGWITGHSYVVYGPLMNGATTLLFESTPVFPNPGRYWEMVERLELDHIYLAPTALRTLRRHGDGWVNKYCRDSLKTLGSVGEPINHEAWDWYFKVVGRSRCDVINTWWQTETGGICLAPRPSPIEAPIRPVISGRPFFGVKPVLVDPGSGQALPEDDQTTTGLLCLKVPFPGMARTLFKDHQRFVDQYFSQVPGMYFTGDGARRQGNDEFLIVGRTDDVINTTGHRLGTAEVEDAIAEHPAVAEAAVVGVNHELKGQAVYAFVVLVDRAVIGGVEIDNLLLTESINKHVRAKIAAYAVPEIIHVCSSLPKTRSGKIMRRILKKVAAGDSSDFGDMSTLANPGIVDDLVGRHKELAEEMKNKTQLELASRRQMHR